MTNRKRAEKKFEARVFKVKNDWKINIKTEKIRVDERLVFDAKVYRVTREGKEIPVEPCDLRDFEVNDETTREKMLQFLNDVTNVLDVANKAAKTVKTWRDAVRPGEDLAIEN